MAFFCMFCLQSTPYLKETLTKQSVNAYYYYVIIISSTFNLTLSIFENDNIFDNNIINY